VLSKTIKGFSILAAGSPAVAAISKTLVPPRVPVNSIIKALPS
jgi:hypothetical protein